MIQSVWKNLTGLQKAAEHLWCDFKWATNSSTNTNDLYIHYMDKSTGTSVWNVCTHIYKSSVFGDEYCLGANTFGNIVYFLLSKRQK